MTQSDNEEHMCKAERLIVAGVVAPSLRAAPESVRKRLVAVVDKDGTVVGYRALEDVQKDILRARAIELETQEGVRPKAVLCQKCGKSFRVKAKGAIGRFCAEHTEVTCACGKKLGMNAARAGISRCGRCVRLKPRASCACGIALSRTSTSQGITRCVKCAGEARRKRVRVACACGAKLGINADYKGSTQCRKCFLNEHTKPPVVCSCGAKLSRGARSQGSTRCQSCARKQVAQQSAQPRVRCPCGAELSRCARRKGTARCVKCAGKARRKVAQ